jgi:hypothetical protein
VVLGSISSSYPKGMFVNWWSDTRAFEFVETGLASCEFGIVVEGQQAGFLSCWLSRDA